MLRMIGGAILGTGLGVAFVVIAIIAPEGAMGSADFVTVFFFGYMLVAICAGPGSLVLGSLVAACIYKYTDVSNRTRTLLLSVFLGIPAGMANWWVTNTVFDKATVEWARSGTFLGAIGGVGLGIGIALVAPRRDAEKKPASREL